MSEYQKAMVVGAFTKAERSPRNEDMARMAIMEVCKRPRFADKATYDKPIGGSSVIGPSIRMAEEMGRLWKNLYVKKTVLYDDQLKRMCNVTVLDLESNLSYSNDFTINKTVERKSYKDRTLIEERINSKGEKIGVVVATEDEVFMKESSQASKEIRTGILRLIPEWLKEDAMGVVFATQDAEAAEDPQAKRREMLDKMATLGVTPIQIEAWLEHSTSTITPAELVKLQNMANTIRDGQATWAEYMAVKAGTPEAKPEPTRVQADENFGFKAGDVGRHTPVQDTVNEIDPMDDPEAVNATINEAVHFLSKSASGVKALGEWHKEFKVADHTQVLEVHRKYFAECLIGSVDKLKQGKK